MFALAGCGDSPLDLESGPEATPTAWQDSLPGLAASPALTAALLTDEYSCVVQSALSGPGPWEYRTRTYRLPALETMAVSGAEDLTTIRFRKRATNGAVIREGVCRIPDTQDARDYVLGYFGMGARPKQAGQSLMGEDEGGDDGCRWNPDYGMWVCEGEPIDVVVPPCEEGEKTDPDSGECVCENGSPELDCWIDPGEPDWPGGPGEGDGCNPYYEWCEPDEGGPGGGGPAQPTCQHLAVDSLVAEYHSGRYEVTLRPGCEDFTNSGGSTHFSWNELNGYFQDGNPHGPWGMVKSSLTNGLEGTRTAYNRGRIRVTSGYRCPHGNDNVGGRPQSRHMYGDAADISSLDHPWTADEYERLRIAAREAGSTWQSEWGDYPSNHLHVDWR